MRLVVALVAVLFLACSAGAAESDLGARLYAERCSGCHGDHGEGDGPAAAALVPKPRNFHDAAFWKGRTLDQVKAVVLKGKPGTMMPPFDSVFSEAELDAVAHFVQRFDPGAPK
jgi:mono/diheme cytochrome c family protein